MGGTFTDVVLEVGAEQFSSGGAGYGDPSQRDHAHLRRDLARGYVSPAALRDDYGLSRADVEQLLDEIARGVDSE